MTDACRVYAIVGRDTSLPTAGPGGSALELALVPWRTLAAVTGRAGSDDAPATMEAVLRHEAVVEAVRRQGPALPVRFGTVFRDAASVASALAQRYDPLVADLERLGDKVELALTALWAAPPPATKREEAARAGQSAGAGYLRARAAELKRDEAAQERARAVARELDRALGALALERRVSLLPTPRVAVRAAYLLEAAGVGAFRRAFEAARPARADLRLLLTGPWPPYSFVRRTEPEGEAALDGPLAGLAQMLTDAMRGHRG